MPEQKTKPEHLQAVLGSLGQEEIENYASYLENNNYRLVSTTPEEAVFQIEGSKHFIVLLPGDRWRVELGTKGFEGKGLADLEKAFEG
jgi:hypothetical protein